ncbi:MAG: hypothetical protein L3K16_06985 [Thermoplasmata archaeon]|nr:hypothetical protein [Thermoplasmata archaeon]
MRLLVGFLVVVGLLSLASGSAEVWSISHGSTEPSGCPSGPNCPAVGPLGRQPGFDAGVLAGGTGGVLLALAFVLWTRSRRGPPPNEGAGTGGVAPPAGADVVPAPEG